eukprot:30957-Pelagococcus_subviridis.AAC.66
MSASKNAPTPRISASIFGGIRAVRSVYTLLLALSCAVTVIVVSVVPYLKSTGGEYRSLFTDVNP